MDADQLDIQARDKEDARKIRACIIIGRDVNPEQVEALRRLNGQLHRIEVFTYDMLLRIGRRVVSVLSGEHAAAPQEAATAQAAADAEDGEDDIDDDIPC